MAERPVTNQCCIKNNMNGVEMASINKVKLKV